LPLAFGIDYEEQKVMPTLGEKITNLQSPEGKIIGKNLRGEKLEETLNELLK
jgi:hypothetical protein